MKIYAGRTAGRAAGQVTAGRWGLDFLFVAGRCGLRARPVRCGPGCGPGYVKICGAGRAAGYDVAKFAVRADCGPSYCGAGRAAGSDFQPAQGLNIYRHTTLTEVLPTVCSDSGRVSR